MHSCMGDHQTTWPCEFECTVGKHKWVVGNVELLWNPRWLPNHMTYITPNTLACGRPPDCFTIQVWMRCGPAWVSYGQCWVTTESMMATKPHNLHSTCHTCMWATTRSFDHVNFNALQVSMSELWATLSYHGIQDGHQTTQITWHLMHLCMGDHKTTSPCKFECAAGKHKWVMVNVELPQNSRWLPNHTTYMAPDTPACGGPPDHLTMWIWMCCRQA